MNSVPFDLVLTKNCAIWFWPKTARSSFYKQESHNKLKRKASCTDIFFKPCHKIEREEDCLASCCFMGARTFVFSTSPSHLISKIFMDIYPLDEHRISSSKESHVAAPTMIPLVTLWGRSGSNLCFYSSLEGLTCFLRTSFFICCFSTTTRTGPNMHQTNAVIERANSEQLCLINIARPNGIHTCSFSVNESTQKCHNLFYSVWR